MAFLGNYKGNKGKVTQVYRKKWAINIEKLSKTKANGKNCEVGWFFIVFFLRRCPGANPNQTLPMRHY
jgi:hypothetical protein